MGNVIIVGTQWGDEGKGKIVDYLTEKADVVARYQGGHNAGHTVVIGKEQFILHLIPSGILHKDKLCLIGNGVVIAPDALIEEIDGLLDIGLEVGDNLKISKNAHVIMPYHIALDNQKEAAKGKKKIGTTGRGIGPAYVDKMARAGIKMVDLLWPDVFREKLESNLGEINTIMTKLYNAPVFEINELFDKCMEYKERLSDFIDDTDIIINDRLKRGDNILFEGAQGTLLDIDHGTYPYVTSSNATAGGAMTGMGVGPTMIDSVLGIAKAYTTRVGGGPFPSELNDETGEKIREKGGEYGATTGRPRRCGWLDLVVLRHSVRINGLTGLVITKLDVLDGFDKLMVCTGYKYGDTVLNDFPKELSILDSCTPVLEEFNGWSEKTKGVKSFKELPENAKLYVGMIEERLDVPIHIISTGQDRDDTIIVKDVF